MMVSPGYFTEKWEKLSYPELIRERDKLIRYIRKYEKKEMAGDRSDPEWRYCPSPEVKYQMHFEYLEAFDFSGTRRACRHRDRHLYLGMLCHQSRIDRSFADAGGTGNDDQQTFFLSCHLMILLILPRSIRRSAFARWFPIAARTKLRDRCP